MGSSESSAAAGEADKDRRHGWSSLKPCRIDPHMDRREWLGFRMAMQDTLPWNLGYGADHVSPGDYDRLEAVAGWRLDVRGDAACVSPWSACKQWRDRVRAELRVVRRHRTSGWWKSAADDEYFRLREMHGLPLSNEKASLLLMGDDLYPHLNEGLLFHGTKPAAIPSILAERFRFDPDTVGSGSGSTFGDGIYLCDRPGKADQYCGLDQAYDGAYPLHRQLWTGPDDHPGHIFCVLACRVTLGYPALTRESKQVAKTIERGEEGEKLFPNQQYAQLPCLKSKTRKLLYQSTSDESGDPLDAAAPGTPIRYHSLFALKGKALRRYREFVVFHPHVLPTYLIAYQRKRGTENIATGVVESATVTNFGKKLDKTVAKCATSDRRGGPTPGVFSVEDVGCSIQVQGNERTTLWRAGELRVAGQPRYVNWDALAPPADVFDATITEVNPKGAFAMVALSNGARFQNPPKPPQPLPRNFRQTADGRWKIRDRDDVRRIRLGDKRAEGRLSRLK